MNPVIPPGKIGDRAMLKYENLTLDEERALYGTHGALIANCTFFGESGSFPNSSKIIYD